MDKSLQDQINEMLIGYTHLDLDAPITEETHLENDLGLDSLDRVEVIMLVEKDFNCNLPDKEAEAVVTVGQLYEITAKYRNQWQRQIHLTGQCLPTKS